MLRPRSSSAYCSANKEEEDGEGENGDEDDGGASDLDKHDNECYVCHEGGRLLLCDWVGCTRASHLKCTEPRQDKVRSVRASYSHAEY